MSVASGEQKTQVYIDSLTQLGNRSKFNETLQKCSQSEVYACIVANINNLKLCNRKYGYSEGDMMIADTAQSIGSACKGLGSCYRIGGDEFCVLIPEKQKEQGRYLLERVKTYIEKKNSERKIPISVALGYAARESADEKVEELFDRSTEKMYNAKAKMKNEFSVYREERIANYLSVLKFYKKITDNYFYIWDIPRDEFWFFEDIDKEYAVHIEDKPTIAAEETKRFVYPADYQMLSEDLARVARGIQKEHNLNYRWVNKKGEPVWINCYGQTIEDDEGNPFCLIGRVSDQALRHLYNPQTKLFNKEKLLQDFAEENISNGYFLLLRVEKMDKSNLNGGKDSHMSLIIKCAEILEENEAAKYLWHTEENVLALYLETESENEVRNLYNTLLKGLDGICSVSAGAVQDDIEMFEHRQELLYTWAKLTLEKAQTISKNALLFFVKEDMEKQMKTVKMLDELHYSIENGCKGFYLKYQPLIKCENYQIYGAEALLRYHSESMGELYPDEFIPLLEQTSMINKIGLWVLEMALKQCGEWRKKIPDFHINVNFSVVQLSDTEVEKKVLKCLEKTGMPGDALTIELTENIQIHDFSYLNKIFRVWRKAGISLSIDDFGTGYASLSYLNQLKVAEMKIDKTFIAGIEEATYNYKLIGSVIDFAKDANIRIICEGVENTRELAVIEQLKPDLMQGYLFAFPCEKELFEKSFLDCSTVQYEQYKRRIGKL